jgi:hypothetical protein
MTLTSPNESEWVVIPALFFYFKAKALAFGHLYNCRNVMIACGQVGQAGVVGQVGVIKCRKSILV